MHESALWISIRNSRWSGHLWDTHFNILCAGFFFFFAHQMLTAPSMEPAQHTSSAWSIGLESKFWTLLGFTMVSTGCKLQFTMKPLLSTEADSIYRGIRLSFGGRNILLLRKRDYVELHWRKLRGIFTPLSADKDGRLCMILDLWALNMHFKKSINSGCSKPSLAQFV